MITWKPRGCRIAVDRSGSAAAELVMPAEVSSWAPVGCRAAFLRRSGGRVWCTGRSRWSLGRLSCCRCSSLRGPRRGNRGRPRSARTAPVGIGDPCTTDGVAWSVTAAPTRATSAGTGPSAGFEMGSMDRSGLGGVFVDPLRGLVDAATRGWFRACWIARGGLLRPVCVVFGWVGVGSARAGRC